MNSSFGMECLIALSAKLLMWIQLEHCQKAASLNAMICPAFRLVAASQKAAKWNGDTLIARITPCLENGKAAYINILNDKEVAFGSTEYIVFSPVDTMPSSFYYFLIRSKKFRTFALQYMNGSSGRQRVSGDELAAFPLTKPSQEALSRFDMVAKPVLEQFKVASLEINRLNALQQLIIASISSR